MPSLTVADLKQHAKESDRRAADIEANQARFRDHGDPRALRRRYPIIGAGVQLNEYVISRLTSQASSDAVFA